MPRCRENRQRRQKRCRRNRLTKLRACLYRTLDLHGNDRPYYEPFNIVIHRYGIRWIRGKPYFSTPLLVSYGVRRTQKYHDLINELIVKFGDVTIDLREIFPERFPEEKGAEDVVQAQPGSVGN